MAWLGLAWIKVRAVSFLKLARGKKWRSLSGGYEEGEIAKERMTCG